MKRLFGLIGLTYLSVLAVVFYFCCTAVFYVIIGLAVVATVVSIFFVRKKSVKYSVIISAVTAVCACMGFVLYQNIAYLPTINDYSDKEINVSGYICDEVQKSNGSYTYTLQTSAINNVEKSLKISIVSYSDINAEAFDKVNCTMHTYKNNNNLSISKGIFLKTYTNEDFTINVSGEKNKTPYYYAVSVRQTLKNSLDTLLPESFSSLCRAVLLGDKQALSSDVRSDFANTGTTFLIVVSGMHLSIITAFVLFLLKKITRNKIIICISVCLTVLLFMAITGFTASVVRSGIMLIITYCGTVVYRKADALNSMGVAALVLTLFNPYAVGDIGLILSFAATAGIVLWSAKISNAINSRIELKFKLLKSFVNAFSVSLAASVAIMPITIVAFNKVSPFVVIVSLLTEPFVSALVVCALLASILFLCPFINAFAYPFALVAGIVSKYILWIEHLFASIPYSSVNTDKIYFYVWMAVTLLLVFVGFFVKKKSSYIKLSAVLSCAVLIAGWGMFSVLNSSVCSLNVYMCGSGVTAGVQSGNRISLVSCGGSVAYSENMIDEISVECDTVDYAIIPNQKNKYSSLQPSLVNEFDVTDILVYDIDSENQKLLTQYDGQSRATFGDNVHFTLQLSSMAVDDVLSINGTVYQYLTCNGNTVLFVPSGADIADLPQQYRSADYLLINVIPDNANLLDCKCVIFSGSSTEYKKNKNSIKEISNNILTTTEISLKIPLKNGGNYAKTD